MNTNTAVIIINKQLNEMKTAEIVVGTLSCFVIMTAESFGG
jgi:hypothetical protein